MTPSEATGSPAKEKPPNKLGISALILLGVNVLSSFLTPVIYQVIVETGAGGTFVTIISPLFSLALTLLAVGLAIAGVLQRRETRYRWAAIGALASGIYILGSFLASGLGQFAASVF